MKIKKDFFKTALIGITVGLCNGLFGSGGGTVVVPAMEKFLHMEEHKSHATAIAVILPLTVVSMILYIYKGFFDFTLAWQVSAGGIAGGALGAVLLKKISAPLLRKIFGVFIIAAAVRMVF
ncbi:MAG: sulfite exporter TauE/SafE family protein [Clostridia bacterium]|nr:sulfite exporter TauE/SafE family protein [Clostridia bacterium]